MDTHGYVTVVDSYGREYQFKDARSIRAVRTEDVRLCQCAVEELRDCVVWVADSNWIDVFKYNVIGRPRQDSNLRPNA